MFTVYESANELTNPQSEGTSGGFLQVPGGLGQWSLLGERQWCVCAPIPTPLPQKGCTPHTPGTARVITHGKEFDSFPK